jgi:folate-dependent phosphoribosylglycinamide formyltransferase PurN
MRVLILKGTAPRHNYFARQIQKIPSIETKVLSFERLGTDRLSKMIKKNPSTFFARIGKYLVYWLKRWNQRELDYFGNEKPEEIVFNSLNDSNSKKFIFDFQPDIIVVFGTPIISSSIISLPKYGSINLHGGISPEYKGGNTIFWPLFLNDLERIGATLHYMEKKVDSGDMLVRVYPEVEEEDDEFSLSAKTFQLATAEMCTLIKNIQKEQRKLIGKPQIDKGRLYLAKHRTIWQDIKSFFIIPKNLKNKSLPQRIERFY